MVSYKISYRRDQFDFTFQYIFILFSIVIIYSVFYNKYPVLFLYSNIQLVLISRDIMSKHKSYDNFTEWHLKYV
jgi:hypothetical protein